ncbi:hypothetical protein [Streptococcus sp. sy010]|uniref:DUF7365 family protein n=1 Tax=Streptococcus sp. sy010 TaxID=2600148 RepID=UPI001C93A9A9|nr:hypothetical protein [Streptococcus sp. sy010]
MMEMKLEHLSGKIDHNVDRLDNHEEQNKSLLIFAEQLHSLTEDVKELNKILRV